MSQLLWDSVIPDNAFCSLPSALLLALTWIDRLWRRESPRKLGAGLLPLRGARMCNEHFWSLAGCSSLFECTYMSWLLILSPLCRPVVGHQKAGTAGQLYPELTETQTWSDMGNKAPVWEPRGAVSRASGTH